MNSLKITEFQSNLNALHLRSEVGRFRLQPEMCLAMTSCSEYDIVLLCLILNVLGITTTKSAMGGDLGLDSPILSSVKQFPFKIIFLALYM